MVTNFHQILFSHKTDANIRLILLTVGSDNNPNKMSHKYLQVMKGTATRSSLVLI